MGGYYRVPADNRDLNYDKYFIEGNTEKPTLHQYTSHNTERLDIRGTIAKMKTTLITSKKNLQKSRQNNNFIGVIYEYFSYRGKLVLWVKTCAGLWKI